MKKWAIVAAAVVVVAGGAAGGWLYLNRKQPFKATATVTFESLDGGPLPSSRDVIVRGGRIYALEVIDGVGRDDGTVDTFKDGRGYMAMVPYGWTKDSQVPVKLVYSALPRANKLLDDIARALERKARISPAPWPRHKEVMAELAKRGFKVDPNAPLLEEPDPEWEK